MMLTGEICCQSLLGLKGLKLETSVFESFSVANHYLIDLVVDNQFSRLKKTVGEGSKQVAEKWNSYFETATSSVWELHLSVK